MGQRETPPEQVKVLKRLAGDREALWLLPSIRPNSEVHVGSRVPSRGCCSAAQQVPGSRQLPSYLSQQQLCTLFALSEQHKWLPVDKDFSTPRNTGAL